MPTTNYIAADGLLRERSLSVGDGTIANPDVVDFSPKYLNDSPITGTSLPSGGAGVIGWLSSIFSNLGRTADTAATSDTGTFSLISLFKRSLQSLTSISSNLGTTADTAATSDTGTFSLISLFKRSLQSLTSISSNLGTTADTAATSDTGTFSLISLFKRSLQSLTSLTTLLSRPSILYVTGTIATTGDNTIVVAPGSGLSIYITHILIQNESATSTTVIVKDTANKIRFLAQTQGTLFSAIFPERREIKLTADTALILNLSGANSIGYSIGYYTAA